MQAGIRGHVVLGSAYQEESVNVVPLGLGHRVVGASVGNDEAEVDGSVEVVGLEGQGQVWVEMRARWMGWVRAVAWAYLGVRWQVVVVGAREEEGCGARAQTQGGSGDRGVAQICGDREVGNDHGVQEAAAEGRGVQGLLEGHGVQMQASPGLERL